MDNWKLMWGVWIWEVCCLWKAWSISNMLPLFFSQLFCHKSHKIPMNVFIKQVETLGVKELHDLARVAHRICAEVGWKLWFLDSHSDNTLYYIKGDIFQLWCIYNQLGFLFFSPHCETLEMLIFKRHCNLSPCVVVSQSLILLQDKKKRVKMQQGEFFEVDPEREWEGRRERELVKPITPEIYHHNGNNELDCRGQCGMGKKALSWLELKLNFCLSSANNLMCDSGQSSSSAQAMVSSSIQGDKSSPPCLPHKHHVR